jgi:hypothetical protein
MNLVFPNPFTIRSSFKSIEFSIALLLIVFSNQLFAQTNTSDSLLLAKAVSNSVEKYNSAINYQSRLYNGKQYAGYPYVFKEGHPFFESVEMSEGTIVYDNQLCVNVFLQFDEVANLVIFKDKTHFTELISSKISEFTLLGNHFIQIKRDSANSKVITKDGFFNVLHNGQSMLLKQEIKIIKEDISSAAEGIKRSITIKNLYYIRKDNEYFTVNNKKDLLAIFEDKKNEIAEYMKTNKLKFRGDIQNSLMKIVGFYDNALN